MDSDDGDEFFDADGIYSDVKLMSLLSWKEDFTEKLILH